MGCTSSKPAQEDLKRVSAPGTGRVGRRSSMGMHAAKPATLQGFPLQLPPTSPLTPSEYRERLVACEGEQSCRLPQAGCLLRYAFVTQRGFYPEARQKSNQDAVFAKHHFADGPENCFFAVFDGHGSNGTLCAQFSKEKVAGHLQDSIAAHDQASSAMTTAMLETNEQLHQSPIDDSMSGTTAIAALVQGRDVTVANVGDSRAIMGHSTGGPLRAECLTRDQTPFRLDECNRVKKCGARVMTLDQIEGVKDASKQSWIDEDKDGGDPPRIWSSSGLYPGTAFTRSIGDQSAEHLGVIADPEITEHRLSPEAPLLILASDGIFEFLSNQTVVDMVLNYHGNLLDAAIHITIRAYDLWLQNETRTDDITIIIVMASDFSESGK
ncbi:hypothetical protein WJX74_008438 [Apatococcus lobatus]|uniref:protein-serine/threonine phosphatase n=1 Tax=Apatococcus lobatus TaxID=904363 RepID=A0AAW1R3U9_9CHLO